MSKELSLISSLSTLLWCFCLAWAPPDRTLGVRCTVHSSLCAQSCFSWLVGLEDTKGERDKREVEKMGVCGWDAGRADCQGLWGHCGCVHLLAFFSCLRDLAVTAAFTHPAAPSLTWEGRPTRKRGLALPSQPSSPYRFVGTEPRGLRQNRGESLGTKCFKRNLGQQGAESLGDSLGILPGYHILQGKLMFPVRVLSLITERV